MKKNIKIVLITAGLTLLFACKKIEDVSTSPLATISIVNAINGANGIKINSNREIVAINSFQSQAIIPSLGGNIKAYDATNNNVYYNQISDTENRALYSLYLTGTSNQPEGVWTKDTIKPYSTENTSTTVRIVNLSPNAGIINVSLASAPSVNVFSNISYKSVTQFQDLPLPLVIPINSNVFQFRDINNNVIASFTLPATARNKSYTIVLKGLVGGAGSSVIGTIGQPHFN